MIKRGSPDLAAERDTHVATAVLRIQTGDGSVATAAALLALETQFARIATVLEGFYQLAKDDEI
jgi:hypothetical protein